MFMNKIIKWLEQVFILEVFAKKWENAQVNTILHSQLESTDVNN